VHFVLWQRGTVPLSCAFFLVMACQPGVLDDTWKSEKKNSV